MKVSEASTRLKYWLLTVHVLHMDHSNSALSHYGKTLMWPYNGKSLFTVLCAHIFNAKHTFYWMKVKCTFLLWIGLLRKDVHFMYETLVIERSSGVLRNAL